LAAAFTITDEEWTALPAIAHLCFVAADIARTHFVVVGIAAGIPADHVLRLAALTTATDLTLGAAEAVVQAGLRTLTAIDVARPVLLAAGDCRLVPVCVATDLIRRAADGAGVVVRVG